MTSHRRFKEVEKEFYSLQKEFKSKKISAAEFRARLKKLRLRDSRGKYWTIGARTGKWYVFDGKKWIEDKPPSITEGKSICIYCGYENDLFDEVCSFCGGRVREKSDDFQNISVAQVIPRTAETEKNESSKNSFSDTVMDESSKSSVYKVHACSITSVVLFFGVLGLFMGMIGGVFFGVMELSNETAKFLPSFLWPIQGKLIGGIIFGVMGSFFGFIVSGFLGWLFGICFNLILSFIGGFKLNITRE